jgi:hypothetical protein
MNCAEFKEYLTTRYRGVRSGKPMSPRVAADAASRCQRVEAVLGVDLGRVLKKQGLAQTLERIQKEAQKFGFGGDQDVGVRTLKYAVRLYAAFLGPKGHPAKRQ